MPTMPETLPLPDAVVDRLANRVTVVQPEPEYCGSESNSTSLDPQDIEHWTAGAAGVSKRQLQIRLLCRYSDNKFLLTVRPTTDRDIVWDVKLSSAGNPAETYPWDIQDLADQLPGEQRLAKESEWEEYEEPLGDPMRAEVRSMVREFYEQDTSAPSDHTLQQHNKGDVIPLEAQTDSSSSSEKLDLTQTGEEFESEIRLVPPPTPEYRVKVKFRFTGEDTPRIHTDPDLT